MPNFNNSNYYGYGIKTEKCVLCKNDIRFHFREINTTEFFSICKTCFDILFCFDAGFSNDHIDEEEYYYLFNQEIPNFIHIIKYKHKSIYKDVINHIMRLNIFP